MSSRVLLVSLAPVLDIPSYVQIMTWHWANASLLLLEVRLLLEVLRRPQWVKTIHWHQIFGWYALTRPIDGVQHSINVMCHLSKKTTSQSGLKYEVASHKELDELHTIKMKQFVCVYFLVLLVEYYVLATKWDCWKILIWSGDKNSWRLSKNNSRSISLFKQFSRSQGPGMIEKAHEGSISSCHLSDDGAMLVTGGYDQTVALWDTENMVQKLRLQVRRFLFLLIFLDRIIFLC